MPPKRKKLSSTPSSRKTARTDRKSSPSEEPTPETNHPVSTAPARSGPTKRRLAIPPGSKPGQPRQTGGAAKKARLDQVDQVMDADRTRPEEEEEDRSAPDEQVREAVRKSVEDEWLTRQQSERLPQLFGRAGHQALVQTIMLDLKKPAMLGSAIKSVSDEQPKPLTRDTIVLLPDAAFAWRRVNSHVDGLIDRLVPRFASGPRRVAAAAAEALRNPENRIKAYDKVGVEKVLEALEMAAAGNVGRLLRIMLESGIGDPGEWQGVQRMEWGPAPFPGPSRPSASLIAQSQGIAKATGGQIDLRLGPLGTALVPGCYAVGKLCDVSEDDREIAALVDQLRARFKETPSAGALFDLAYLSRTLGPRAPEPTVMTADWNLLDGFSGRAGTAGRQTAAYGTNIGGGVNIRVHPLKTPANPQLAPTPMRKLVDDAPDTVAYGTEVKVDPGTDKEFTAYVYGYDMRGRVRVVWPDRETQELLAPSTPMTVSTNSEGQIVLRNDILAVAPPTDASSVTNFEWKPKQYSLDALSRAFPALADHARKLPELAKRHVAERADLTVDQYVKLITDAGFQCFVTGGAVRDILLGGDPKDIDLATTMPAPDLYADIVSSPKGLGKKGGRRGEPEVRKNFPYSIVQIEPTIVTGLDILSTHGTSHGSSSLSLDVDALARDFTINAIYFDPTNGLIIDPTGSGLQDIVDKKLRFVLKPGKAVAADPVMAARWIKFMSRDYTPADPDDKTVVTVSLSATVPKMDSTSRSRFIDRSGLSPKELVAAAQKLSPDLEAAIRGITGT